MEMTVKAYVLTPEERAVKKVCPRCVQVNSIIYDSCPVCHGNGFIKKRYQHFSVRRNLIDIVKISREELTGHLIYWTSASEFYHEETYNTDNKYVPDVPYGIHFIHFTKEDAEREAERINKYLESGI